MGLKKNTALYVGSFDPVTLGHLDVLRSASEVFENVIIAIADNPDKRSLFSIEDRKHMIELSIEDLSNVEVDSFSGLTVEYAKSKGVNVLIRGLRSVTDFEFEKELAQNNGVLAPEIKTVFFMTNPEHSYISSSAVREILNNKGDVSKFVSDAVLSYLLSI